MLDRTRAMIDNFANSEFLAERTYISAVIKAIVQVANLVPISAICNGVTTSQLDVQPLEHRLVQSKKKKKTK